MSALAKRLFVGFFLTSICDLTACSSQPLTKQECEQLLDRYVVHLAHVDAPKPPGRHAIELLQQKAHNRAKAFPEFQNCSQKVTRSQYECAMHSNTERELEMCLIPVPF
jgi:hypothetical protein